jgi:hypothetical protein
MVWTVCMTRHSCYVFHYISKCTYMYILSNGKQQISKSICVDGARFGLAGREKTKGSERVKLLTISQRARTWYRALKSDE